MHKQIVQCTLTRKIGYHFSCLWQILSFEVNFEINNVLSVVVSSKILVFLYFLTNRH